MKMRGGTMTIECLNKIIMDNFYDEDDHLVDISGLKFDCNVEISDMKVSGELWQQSQKVGSSLYQSSQKVGGDLIQDNHIINGDLYQDKQTVKGCLYQGKQDVGLSLYQGDSKVGGLLIQDHCMDNQGNESKWHFSKSEKVLEPREDSVGEIKEESIEESAEESATSNGDNGALLIIGGKKIPTENLSKVNIEVESGLKTITLEYIVFEEDLNFKTTKVGKGE